MMIRPKLARAGVIFADDDATTSDDKPSQDEEVIPANDNAIVMAVKAQRFRLQNHFDPRSLLSSLGLFLKIPLKSIPISENAFAAQMKWTDWSLLLISESLKYGYKKGVLTWFRLNSSNCFKLTFSQASVRF